MTQTRSNCFRGSQQVLFLTDHRFTSKFFSNVPAEFDPTHVLQEKQRRGEEEHGICLIQFHLKSEVIFSSAPSHFYRGGLTGILSDSRTDFNLFSELLRSEQMSLRPLNVMSVKFRGPMKEEKPDQPLLLYSGLMFEPVSAFRLSAPFLSPIPFSANVSWESDLSAALFIQTPKAGPLSCVFHRQRLVTTCCSSLTAASVFCHNEPKCLRRIHLK